MSLGFDLAMASGVRSQYPPQHATQQRVPRKIMSQSASTPSGLQPASPTAGRGRWPALVMLFALALLPTSARAGPAMQAGLGVVGTGSSWRGDGGGGAAVRFGYRFLGWLAADVLVREQLLSVDQRLNTGLTLGVTAYWPRQGVRPSARIYAVHQHEEGLVSVLENPWGVLLGIGDGIRHRAGGGFSAGAEVPFLERGRWEWCIVTNASATYFPDTSLGPAWYVGGFVGLGFNYATGDPP